MSLRRKVNTGVFLLLLIAVLASMSLLISNARQSVHADAEDAMRSAAELITVLLSGEYLSREMSMRSHVERIVPAISQIRSLHILMFGRDGLLFEGEPKAFEKEAPNWFIDLLKPDIKPFSRRFGSGHMVIYASPLQEIDARWRDVRGLLVLGLLMLLATIALLYWGLGRITKPLDRISKGLASIEQGDLNLRLPHFGLEEMDQIGQTFNRMGEALTDSMAENRRMAILVQQSGDAILSVDLAGKIDFCNPAAAVLFGETANKLVGRSIATLGFSQSEDEIMLAVARGQAVENIETSLNQDSHAALLFSAMPLLDPGDITTGLVCTLRDITEHKEAEAAAQQLYETRLLAQHMAEVQEKERRHLSQELHDELGQCLTAIKTDAVLISNRSEAVDSKIHVSARAIIDVTSHIYDVVHNMITRLRPSPLDDLGLVATLEESIAKWQQRQSQIEFKLELAGELNDLGETLSMTVFRVVQEALTNAVRHADATEIMIQVQRQEQTVATGDLLSLTITDNGKGMVVEDFHSEVDFGLLGMRERVRSLSGQFEIVSVLGEGLSIQITIPLVTEG
jgi:PAS domain S-box-containing protein